MNRKGLEVRKRKGKKIADFYLKRDLDLVKGSKEYWTDPKNIGRKGQTPCSCSCWLCGNRRRQEKGKSKLTIKERLFLLDHLSAMKGDEI